MDVDGSSISNPQNSGDIDQNLLLQFSCMNTTDREELISQMQKLLGPSVSSNTASFFLDMSNWNLQAAICCYLDYTMPPKLPRMSLKSTQNMTSGVMPGAYFEHSWQLANTGSEQWPGSCKVIQAGGVPLSATPTYVPALPPGESITVTVKLVAPATPGTHKAFFYLVNNRDEQIGETLWLEIIVESEITMALVEQLAALPVPSSRSNDVPSNLPQMPSSQDDQMC